jgi:MFS family permease
VFRKPAHLQVFAGLIGSGYQLVAMAFLGILAAATAGETGDQKSATMSFVIIYALTSFVAGYSSAAYYRSHFYPEPSPQWCSFGRCCRASVFHSIPLFLWTRKRVMFLTAGLLPGSVFVTLLVLNSVALSYNTINTIPFSMMVSTVLVWLLVSLPMVIGGSILGRYGLFPVRCPSFGCCWPTMACVSVVGAAKQRFPVALTPSRAQFHLESGTRNHTCVVVFPLWVPPPFVLGHALFPCSCLQLVCLLTGVLPFGSIFMEMYFIFTSVWNYKFYYVYGFMLLVYVILAVVTCWFGRVLHSLFARTLLFDVALAWCVRQCDHCGGLFPAKLRRLPLALAEFLGSGVHGCVRFPVRRVLLFHEDGVRSYMLRCLLKRVGLSSWVFPLQYDRVPANKLLLRVLGPVLRRIRVVVRYHRLLGELCVRQPYLPKHQGGLRPRCFDNLAWVREECQHA